MSGQELRSCCFCSCKPVSVRTNHKGVQREDTGVQIPQNPSHIIFCLRQQPTGTKCPVLKGRSAKLLSRLSTAGEWNRHLQICVSHPSNKYSVERRNLSQRMHGARDRLCSQALPFCRDLRQRLLAGLNVPPCELREGLGVEKRYLSSFITGLPVIEGVQEKEAKGRFHLVGNMHENVAPSPQGNLPEVRNPLLFALLFLVLWIVSGHRTLTQEISHGPSFVEASKWHSLIIVAGRQWRDTLHPNNLQVNIAGSLERVSNQESEVRMSWSVLFKFRYMISFHVGFSGQSCLMLTEGANGLVHCPGQCVTPLHLYHP